MLNLLRNPAEDKEVRAKAQYALSGSIKHFPAAIDQFREKGGFDVLADIVKKPEGKNGSHYVISLWYFMSFITSLELDSSTLRKTIFLYNTLMLENPTVAKLLVSQGIHDALANVLSKAIEEEDEDLAEKVWAWGTTFTVYVWSSELLLMSVSFF